MTDVQNRIPGSLSQLNLDTNDRELLLDYMANANPSSYTDLIWSMMGDHRFLMFFDVLEGCTIKVPSRQSMARIVGNLKIYSYLKERGNTDEAYEKASHIFKKRDSVLRKIYDTIDRVLNGEEIDTEVEDEEDD